jgi:hypothetical protein
MGEIACRLGPSDASPSRGEHLRLGFSAGDALWFVDGKRIGD